MGGCATYGCKAATVAEKPPMPTATTRGWGDEKTCPSCSKQILAGVMFCSCGARFPWADPMTPTDYQEWVSEEALIKSRRRQLVWLFVATILGIAAPVTGAIAGIQAYRSRTLLIGEAGTYLALGYGATLIGFVYTLVILLLMIGL